MSYSIRRVSGSSRDASRLSTGLMTYFLTASTCSAVSSPSRTYTLAVRTVGRSPWDKIWMHWAAESARWSILAGQILYGEHRVVPAGTSLVTVSSWGSDSTV